VIEIMLRERNLIRRWAPWIVVISLTAALTILSVRETLTRYRELNSAWAWDLAHNNQWLWALTHRQRAHTVRPWAPFATEGPSLWKSNHLDPIRLLVAPFYMLDPEPPALLVLQCVVVWWCLPAAFVLVRHESGSAWVALSAVALVPLTPMLRPLILDDFRDIQLGIPFVLLAVDGCRGRAKWIAAVSIAWILACRQEYALAVALFALVPARRAEDPRQTRRWALAVIGAGVGWTLIYVAYLAATAGPLAPIKYFDQFADDAPIPAESLYRTMEFLVVGLGSWGLLAFTVP
jgi:uncharacterized membrane protein